jgi:hypothetical protein
LCHDKGDTQHDRPRHHRPPGPSFLAAEDLARWRFGASPGATITYYAGTASLMRARTKDVALEQTAAAAWSIYMAGRGILTFCQRPDGIGEYRLTAGDFEPVVERDRAPPPTQLPSGKPRQR